MSAPAIQSPTPVPAASSATASLAPPASTSRPSSASSNRSNGSSRRGRSRGPSSNNSTSRSNSHSSTGSKSKPLSGGTSLGVRPENHAATGSTGQKGRREGSSKGKSNGKKEEKGGNGSKDMKEVKDGKEGKNKEDKKGQKPSRPTPITVPPNPTRTASQSSATANENGVELPPVSQSAPAPRSIKAVASTPRTAMDAAMDAAKQKHGGDALSSLQKMISDLKTLPPGAPVIGSGGSSAGNSRSASGREYKDESASPPTSTSPVNIPLSSKQLKADAPTFTPSLRTSTSPIAISPNDQISPSFVPSVPSIPSVSQQHRSASMSSTRQAERDRRTSSSSFTAQSQPGHSFSISPATAYGATIPHFPLANVGQFTSPLTNLPNLPETDEFMYTDQYSQLLAAQRIQYQQIQLLQAQIAANQLAQQQAQQQQLSMGLAPRFRALAEQRQAHVTQQQVAALAQAQQVYEVQQQALLAVQRAQQDAAQATLRNPPPVFEEDDEPQYQQHNRMGSISGSGAGASRRELNPGFTFGQKRNDSVERQPSASQSAIRVDRSQGIGGAEATGLAGLAARAHKRTGSELTPAMQKQLELQNQIEALQAQQKALMQEEYSGTGSSALSQISSALHRPSASSASMSAPSMPPPSRGHRRVQSSAVTSGMDTYGTSFEEPSLLEQMRPTRGSSNEMPPPPVPTGHNRRHSMNVLNKSTSGGFGSVDELPEDMIANGGGHHRTGSRSGMESGNWRSVTQQLGQVTDLASAQAQLQSLAQFRAAAGGGHNRMASFALPNMLPNLLAATTLSSPGGTNLWQQQQAFQMQLQQNTAGPQRKSLFAPYLPQASLPPLLQAGKLVVGILRVNKKNRSDAYVATDVLESDIYICGSKDRNRALEGDIVAVELLDVDEVWMTKKDKEEKKRKKEENSIYDLKPVDRKKVEKKKDDVEVEGQGLLLAEEEMVDDVTKPMYAGHVVAVVERMPGQLFSGQLGVLRPSSAATKEKQELERRERGDQHKRDEPEARPKIVWFKPTDKRVPLIAIPTEQAPDDFLERPEIWEDRLFVATIKRWPITSLHPFGTLVEELGPIGDPEVETSALLKDCNFPTEEFGEQTLKCLPPLPWSIPDREYEVRQDLRQDRIFTIDPPTAKDLDDALSIKRHDDGSQTVGVHIADVSYFVKPNTALDREARKRGTSVYLVQRSVPMLPPQLSEELCSLQPGVERLAFSAFFEIDKNGRVGEKRFARTVVKTCAKYSYSTVQGIIDGSSVSKESVLAGQDAGEVQKDILALQSTAAKLRAQRIELGALTSDRKIKVSFTLNEQNEAVDVEAYKRTDAHTLVEEFMLLANSSVAQIIANGLPEQSLLRRHEPPLERRIEGFVKRAQKLGYQMDGSSAGALQRSFAKIEDPEVALCLELLKRKAMTSAKYFCTGMLDIAKYGHWALSVPLYTHFTNDVKFVMDRDQVAKVSQQCNMKKAGAKLAEEQSVHLHLCMLIHELTEKYGPVIREGRVTYVLDAAFDVVIPEFGIEKRVHVDKMPLDSVVHDEHRDQLSLYWTKTDILDYLAETLEDPSMLDIKRRGVSAQLESARTDDLFESDSAGGAGKSQQHQKSANRKTPVFQGLRSSGNGHNIQDIKELMSIPVIVMSDMTRSPPVLTVYACNPSVPFFTPESSLSNA